MEMGPNMWNGVLTNGDDAQPFWNCMPLSNQGSCKYLIRADPLLSGSLFSHPFLFVVLPRMVIRICDNQHSSTHIRMSKLGSKRREGLVTMIEQRWCWALLVWFMLRCFMTLFLFHTTIEFLWWFNFPLESFCTPSSELVPGIFYSVCCLTSMAHALLVSSYYLHPKKNVILSLFAAYILTGCLVP